MFEPFIMPSIDPIAIQLGPFAIRWYALSYIAGIVLGWPLARQMVADAALWNRQPGNPALIDDLIVWVAFGIILGGRLGDVLIYAPAYYWTHPLEIVQIWHGGMAFHGGLAGAVLAIVLFARRHGVPILSYLDVAACVTPIGLFLGRLANFANAELWGRVTDVPWAVVFCNERIIASQGGDCPAGSLPRHPSQLYEAALEGVALFLVMLLVSKTGGLKRPGLASGIFLLGYAAARSFSELYREPDGYVLEPITTGMALSVPLLVAGILLIWNAKRSETP